LIIGNHSKSLNFARTICSYEFRSHHHLQIIVVKPIEVDSVVVQFSSASKRLHQAPGDPHVHASAIPPAKISRQSHAKKLPLHIRQKFPGAREVKNSNATQFDLSPTHLEFTSNSTHTTYNQRPRT
jgi:hypothetical protein